MCRTSRHWLVCLKFTIAWRGLDILRASPENRPFYGVGEERRYPETLPSLVEDSQLRVITVKGCQARSAKRKVQGGAAQR